MEGILLTTRGSNNEYQAKEIIGGFVTVIAGIIILMIELFVDYNRDVNVLFVVIGCVVILFGVNRILRGKELSKTYIDFFIDHIEGVAQTKGGITGFWVRTEHIIDVTPIRNEIHICTGDDKYKVLCGQYMLQQVIAYFIK